MCGLSYVLSLSAVQFSRVAGDDFALWHGVIHQAVDQLCPLMVLRFLLALVIIIFLSDAGGSGGYGVKTRVEGRGERGSAQAITMGSKPQNIYLFQLNDSIKWTPAMFLA